jgi:hypothetical protein
MNKSDEIAYLGRVISLLGRHQQLSLGEIKNKTRAFLRKRHQTDSSVFNTLELYVTQGMLARKVYKSRIYYTLSEMAQGNRPPEIKPVDLVEAAVESGNALVLQMIEQAKRYTGTKQPNTNLDREKTLEYKEKAPPPNSTEGFK